MSYIDTHCHLDFPQYHQDMEEVIGRALEQGVSWMINIGTDLVTSKASLNLASRYWEIFATVGFHPHDARRLDAAALSELEVLARDVRVVAIGEIGLDYFRDLSARDAQQLAFKKQLELALKLNKPVVIHCRDAYRDVIALLDEVYLPYLRGRPPGVIHSFSAGVQYLKEFLKRGFYVGFNGMVTYPGSTALLEAVKAAPLDRILLETDAPFLAPDDKRGGRNEPTGVIAVAAAIAGLKNLRASEVAHQTSANATLLFGLK